MKLKHPFTFFCTFLVAGLTAHQAAALQFGVNAEFTAGVVDPDDKVAIFDDDYPTATQKLALAMRVCETCSLFHYRLNVGYGWGVVEYQDNPVDIEDDIGGYHINNTFGFNIIKNDNLTFWAGPSVYFMFHELDGDVSDHEDTTSWGAGPTAGLDFNFANGSSISMEAGWRFLYVDYGADYEDIDLDFDNDGDDDVIIDQLEEDIDGKLNDLTFRVTYFFY